MTVCKYAKKYKDDEYTCTHTEACHHRYRGLWCTYPGRTFKQAWQSTPVYRTLTRLVSYRILDLLRNGYVCDAIDGSIEDLHKVVAGEIKLEQIGPKRRESLLELLGGHDA